MLRTLLLTVALLLALPAPAVTLKIATLVPDGTTWMKLMRAGAETVAERTAGRVELRFYPGGVMGNDASVMRKIRIGQLHGGVLTAGELTSIYNDSQIYSIPYLFRSFDEVDYVRQRVDARILDGLRQAGYVSYGLSEGGFAFIMSRSPVSSIEQLRRQKVWTPENDPHSLAAFQALGVSPIPLPLTDVLTGLQTGLIDTIGASPVAAIALQWHTRVKYLTEMPVLYFYGTMILQEKALKRVSEADRAVLREVLEATFREIDQATRRDNEQAHQALLAQGIESIQPTAQELAEWHREVGQAVERMTEQQVFSDVLLGEIRGYLERFRQQQ